MELDAADALPPLRVELADSLAHALAEAGRSVPGDVRVAGFDDVPEAAYYSPPLTTVRQDFLALGRTTCDQLLRLVAGEPDVPARAVVPAELVVRDSTGPHPAR